VRYATVTAYGQVLFLDLVSSKEMRFKYKDLPPNPLAVTGELTSTFLRVSSLSSGLLTGINPFSLSVYDLSARCPTLKAACYHAVSKDLLPGDWPAFRGGILTR
jgi:hypothetical protein